MSVKFQEQTVRVAGQKTEDLAHQIGDRLTGGRGASGYLAVCFLRREIDSLQDDKTTVLIEMDESGLSAPAAVEPAAHEDDHVGFPVGSSRTARFVDRTRC